MLSVGEKVHGIDPDWVTADRVIAEQQKKGTSPSEALCSAQQQTNCHAMLCPTLLIAQHLQDVLNFWPQTLLAAVILPDLRSSRREQSEMVQL